MEREALLAIARLARALAALHVPYFVGGSLASSAHGIPRMTRDVDMVAALGLPQVAPFVSALDGEYYLDRSSIEDAIRRRGSFNVIYLSNMYKVDVFIPRFDALAREEMARCQIITLNLDEEEIALPFCSPEDIVLEKLDWYHAGGRVSDGQWTDVRGVLSVQKHQLDYQYLRHWAAERGIVDLLNRALEEAGIDG